MKDPTPPGTPAPVGVSIGAMSRATGVPPSTLRTWERRYGFPSPQRTESGQRLYDPALIDHLRLISAALESGHRPKQVLAASKEELQALVATAAQSNNTATALAQSPLEQWMRAARELDSETLDRLYRSDIGRLGIMRVLTDRVGPFIHEMGEAWRRGDLKVYQEHWASEHIRRHLQDTWETLSATNRGSTLVASTLPADPHDLGLHMACVVAAMSGWRIVFLGRETPISDVVAAVHASGSKAALLSVSAWAKPEPSRADLRELRTTLPGSVEVLVGGAGAPRNIAELVTLNGLDALNAWASQNN